MSLCTLIELANLPTEQARKPLVEQLLQGMMSTEDIRTIVQEVLSQLQKSTSHPQQQEKADALVFQRVLNNASRRMNSALTQLKAVAEVYRTDLSGVGLTSGQGFPHLPHPYPNRKTPVRAHPSRSSSQTATTSLPKYLPLRDRTDPDTKKKDLLREYIENAMSEIKQVEGMLH